MRRVAYVTGTRADFGLMQSTLQTIARSPELDLSIIATGMHLDPAYGNTLNSITAAGLPVSARVEIESGVPSGALMASNIGRMIIGFTQAMQKLKPDIVLLLGDRGEMLAAAIAALHLNVAIVHIHGGELSGTVDEPVRHAISKLAHFHFTATDESRQRLIRMGEHADRTFVTGAPGLDGLEALRQGIGAALLSQHGLDPALPFALLLYHPVVQEAAEAGVAATTIIETLTAAHIQVLALKPNSDAGSADILAALEKAQQAGSIALVTHLPRPDFATLLEAATLLIGNSSSGIIEAATFGTPVVNIGSRQNRRQRNANVLDSTADPEALGKAIATARTAPRLPGSNVYGDGQAGNRIVHLLATVDLGAATLDNNNAY